MKRSWSVGFACACAMLAWTATASHAQTLVFVGKTTDVTNYGDAGLNIGNAGYWFAQFGASAPVTNQPVNNNDRNAFPSWIVPNFDAMSADYSFGANVYSRGGESTWNTLTLPNNEVGLSGTLVDPDSAGNSNNTIPKLLFGAGLPSDFLMHVVVDNANTNVVIDASRLRGRGEAASGTPDLTTNVAPGVAGFNNTADVYTFRYTGWAPGDFIKIQTNSGVAGVPGGFAGLMFDVVPEPGSASLLALGVVALRGVARRRRR